MSALHEYRRKELPRLQPRLLTHVNVGRRPSDHPFPLSLLTADSFTCPARVSSPPPKIIFTPSNNNARYQDTVFQLGSCKSKGAQPGFEPGTCHIQASCSENRGIIPEATIIRLDHWAVFLIAQFVYLYTNCMLSFTQAQIWIEETTKPPR